MVKKIAIGMILTMAALVVIVTPQYVYVPDVFGQGTDTVETVNV